MSKTFRTRPSEFLDVDHPVQAFYFDRAVFNFGQAFDQDIEEQDQHKGKRPLKPEAVKLKKQRRLRKWLEDDLAGQPTQFRDPSVGGGRRNN